METGEEGDEEGGGEGMRRGEGDEEGRGEGMGRQCRVRTDTDQ